GRDPERAGELAAGLAAALPDAEVLDWKTVAPEMVSLVEVVNVAWVLVLALVFVAAAAGVAHTERLAPVARTAEARTPRALRARPGRVVVLVVVEALALGVVGALLGTALGGGLVALTHETGLDLARLTGGGPSQISFAGMSWSMRLYPTLALIDVARVAGAVVATSLLAAVWPAARAARLAPAAALRA